MPADRVDSRWARAELRRHDIRMVLEAAETVGRFARWSKKRPRRGHLRSVG